MHVLLMFNLGSGKWSNIRGEVTISYFQPTFSRLCPEDLLSLSIRFYTKMAFHLFVAGGVTEESSLAGMKQVLKFITDFITNPLLHLSIRGWPFVYLVFFSSTFKRQPMFRIFD